MKRSRGFTLIEIAIVLGIVLALLSLGLATIKSQLSSASYSITKKRQDAIKDALIAYLGANKRLPCPYVPTAGSPVTGIAPGVPPACPQLFGTVPFATLGLAREIGTDGWGNLFSYQLYADTPPPIICPGTGRDWGNSACFGAGKIGGITVNDRTVPVATPKDIVSRLSAETNRVTKLPDMKERLDAGGFEPVGTTPEQFATYLRNEVDKWAKIVKAVGARVD